MHYNVNRAQNLENKKKTAHTDIVTNRKIEVKIEIKLLNKHPKSVLKPVGNNKPHSSVLPIT